MRIATLSDLFYEHFYSLEGDRGFFKTLEEDFLEFERCVIGHYRESLRYFGYDAEAISRPQLKFAHKFWVQDLERLRNFSLSDSETISHYKKTAFLIYWLRRCDPIVEIYALEPEEDKNDYEKEWSEKVVKIYPGIYSSFKLGFDICRIYMADNADNKDEYYANDFSVGIGYVRDICHLMKSKELSPHAMYMILLSLFENVLKSK